MSDDKLKKISVSRLKHYKISPKHYRYYTLNPKEATDAFLFGTQYHDILECRIMNKPIKWVVFDPMGRPEPDKSMGSKLNKIYKDNFLVNNEYVISQESLGLINTMVDELLNDYHIAKLLRKPDSVIEQMEEIDIEGVKARWIADIKNDKAIIDFKTIQTKSLVNFERDIANFDYHLQAGFYVMCEELLTGLTKRFIWLVQEKTPPFDYMLFEATEAMIRIGIYEVEQLLSLHKYCINTNHWPGRKIYVDDKKVDDIIYNPARIQLVDLPKYAIKEINYYI
jgi:exodeoxyribonuclease VIII